MKPLKKFLHVLVCLIFLVMLFFSTSTCTSQSDQPNHRNESKALTPFLNHSNSEKSSPSEPNLLLLFNCSIRKGGAGPLYIQNNCTEFHTCRAAPTGYFPSKIEDGKAKISHQCLLVDVKNLSEFGFHPKDLNCTHYFWVHKARSSRDEQGYEIEMRMSFDINLPDLCKECEKPNGKCGVALRCVCHPKQCKEKAISEGSSLTSTICHISFSILSSLFLTGAVFFLMNV